MKPGARAGTDTEIGVSEATIYIIWKSKTAA